MSNWFANQQDYIDTLQVQLNEGISDKKFIQHHWPKADETKVWGDTPGFEVRLQSYGRVWGKASDQHTAWSMARKNLEAEGVLAAFETKEGWDV